MMKGVSFDARGVAQTAMCPNCQCEQPIWHIVLLDGQWLRQCQGCKRVWSRYDAKE